MNREDFPMLEEDLIYFDNAATSFKPISVIESIATYYMRYSVNANRSDYKLSHQIDELYELTREKVKRFIKASDNKEVVFTSGTTESLNMIAFGYLKYVLKKGDEVLVTKSEHASLLMPLFELEDEIGIKIKFLPLDDENKLTFENVKKYITRKTKVIAIAHIPNVIGDIRPIRKICELANERNIITIIDAAQSIAHLKIDVQKIGMTFLAFSGHKLYGPTGTGILYGKVEHLEKMVPLKFGGGMNISFRSKNSSGYKDLPIRLEAGTQNLAGIIGLGAAIDYVKEVGLHKIREYETELVNYLYEKLKQLPNIEIYNKKPDSAIVTFNVKDVFSEDVARFLDKNKICVRAGSHCAKMLRDEININNTCRISLAFYNTKEEIDKVIEVLKEKNIVEEII